MTFNSKMLKRVSGLALSFVLVSALSFTTFSVAFGDFVPVTEGKVLGVGRIQSTIPEVPVAPEAKFALATSPEVLAEQASELNEPIAREVAAVPVPVLPDPVISESSNSSSSSSSEAQASASAQSGGWVTTMATNYATPSDGFLNKMTANGDMTSETSMGVAHKNLALGTIVELYCPQSGLSCIAVVNDRGPYGGYWGGQPDTFDLQMAVTWALGENSGWYTVQYRIVSRAITVKAENVS